MYASSLIVLALAAFGSAQIISSGCGCGVPTVGFSTGCGVQTVGFNTGSAVQTVGFNAGSGVGVSPVIENVPIRIPGCVSPTTVQETCNCVKTIVRPHVRKEVFTIPSVQRFVQTTSTPVVETVPYVSAAGVDVPSAPAVGSCGASGVLSGNVFNGGYGFRYGNGLGAGCGCGCGY